MIFIDIDMPKCCADCPLYNDNYIYPTCNVTGTSKRYNFDIYGKRMPDCPLYEEESAKDIIRSLKV